VDSAKFGVCSLFVVYFSIVVVQFALLCFFLLCVKPMHKDVCRLCLACV
jgi:hypothetical protein